MTISEAIEQLTTYTIPCGKYKEAYDMAIETMRKYQKIEKIVKAWNDMNSFDSMVQIREVLEDDCDDGESEET